MKTNFHTHTLYSDGKAEPEAYIQQSLKLNLKILGFTEHSPLPFENPFSFRQENREKYCNQINALKSEYSDQIDIYLAMEMDYIPGMSEEFSKTRMEFGLDYQIGAVHLVRPGRSQDLWFTDGPSSETYDQGLEKFFGGDIRKAVTTYYRQLNEMIVTQQFEIIAHFDKIKMHNRGRFFREDEHWYRELVDETIGLIRERELIVEVNTRGIYKKRAETTYPGLEILRKLKKRDIPVMVNSDAHLPEEIDGSFGDAFCLLQEAGIGEVAYFDNGIWKSQPLETVGFNVK